MSSLKTAILMSPQETVPFEDQIVCGYVIKVIQKQY